MAYLSEPYSWVYCGRAYTSSFFLAPTTLLLSMAAVHPAIARAIHSIEPSVTLQQKASHVQSTSGKTYFAKVGSLHEIEQYVAEAEALKTMHLAAPGLAPRLIDSGVIPKEVAEKDSDVGRPYFVSEYKDMSSLTDASGKRLAQRLATEMHAYSSSDGFGFGVPTFCGRTKQDNGWYDSWEACFDALLAGLLSKLETKGGFEELCRKGRQVRERFELLTHRASYRVYPLFIERYPHFSSPLPSSLSSFMEICG